uniref:hypothetical protein n=1 Tax=Butyricimonas virosa TaxID=544645 RepID=UPI004026AD35
YRKKASYRYNTNTESLGYNILNEIANSGSTSETSHLAASLDFSWDITDWLKYQFTGGYNRSMNTSSVYRSERTFAVANEVMILILWNREVLNLRQLYFLLVAICLPRMLFKIHTIFKISY